MKTEIVVKVEEFLDNKGQIELFDNYKKTNNAENLRTNDVQLDIVVLNFLTQHYGNVNRWEEVICFEDNDAMNLVFKIHEGNRVALLDKAINAFKTRLETNSKPIALPENSELVTLNQTSYAILSELIDNKNVPESSIKQIEAISEEPSIKADLFCGCNITDNQGHIRIQDYVSEQQMEKALAQAVRAAKKAQKQNEKEKQSNHSEFFPPRSATSMENALDQAQRATEKAQKQNEKEKQSNHSEFFPPRSATSMENALDQAQRATENQDKKGNPYRDSEVVSKFSATLNGNGSTVHKTQYSNVGSDMDNATSCRLS